MRNDTYIRKAIRYCGGKQKNLAKRMKIKPSKVSYLLNYARKIKIEDAIKMELAVDGMIKWHQFIDSPYQKINNSYKDKINESIPHVDVLNCSLSEKIQQAINYEKARGNHQGKRNDLILRENPCKVAERTDREIAKLFQIGSEWTYRQAKKILQKGTPELIEHMNQKTLKIWVLALLADCPPEEQQDVLQKTSKEIITYVKNIKSAAKEIKSNHIQQSSSAQINNQSEGDTYESN